MDPLYTRGDDGHFERGFTPRWNIVVYSRSCWHSMSLWLSGKVRVDISRSAILSTSSHQKQAWERPAWHPTAPAWCWAHCPQNLEQTLWDWSFSLGRETRKHASIVNNRRKDIMKPHCVVEILGAQRGRSTWVVSKKLLGNRWGIWLRPSKAWGSTF